MKEIVNIHVGQCGNQIGYDFWEGVCQEHSIQPDLTCSDYELAENNNTYFEEIDSGRFVPRAVLVDLEPGVHNRIAQQTYGSIFNPDMIYNDQPGAGNNFAMGFYSTGSEIIEEVMEGIRKQAEKCDCMEGFQLTHSLGGGTGSGLGSLVMQNLKGEFSDKMLTAYSVVPSIKTPEVVIQPYNSILSMNYLIEECDSNVLISNDSLNHISQFALKQKDVSISFINKIVKRAMLETTSSLRFGGFNNAGMRKLNTNLCPFPRLHFLTTTLAPLSNMEDKVYDVMGPQELIRELFSSNNAICDVELTRGKLLTAAAIFRGDIESSAAESSLAKLREKNSGEFVEWIPDNLMSSICSVPNADYSSSAVLLSNTTSIQTLFKTIDDTFTPLIRRKAYMHHYIREGMEWSEMTEAQMNMLDLINEYQQYEEATCDEDYEDDEDEEMEPDFKGFKTTHSHSDLHSTHASSCKE